MIAGTIGALFLIFPNSCWRFGLKDAMVVEIGSSCCAI
jgi:hypothetical protein